MGGILDLAPQLVLGSFPALVRMDGVQMACGVLGRTEARLVKLESLAVGGSRALFDSLVEETLDHADD